MVITSSPGRMVCFQSTVNVCQKIEFALLQGTIWLIDSKKNRIIFHFYVHRCYNAIRDRDRETNCNSLKICCIFTPFNGLQSSSLLLHTCTVHTHYSFMFELMRKNRRANHSFFFRFPYRFESDFSKLIRFVVAASVKSVEKLQQIQNVILLTAHQTKSNKLHWATEAAAAIISFFRDYDSELLQNCCCCCCLLCVYNINQKKSSNTRCTLSSSLVPQLARFSLDDV